MDVFTLWERILAHVRQNDPQYSAMFLKEIFPESFQGGVFTAVVKKEYIASWLQTMYLNKMESIIARETGAPRGFIFTVSPRKPSRNRSPRFLLRLLPYRKKRRLFLLLTARLFLRKILFQKTRPLIFPASARFP